MKKVLLIIIDALASRALIPALEANRLPTFQALAARGTLRTECTAIFPSVTPAATSSIITGQYPSQHGILGFHWYDTERNKVLYFGNDFWVIWNKGLAQFFEEFLANLNNKQLQTNTLFQTVEQAGLKAASLNYLIFQGDVEHKLDLPLIFNLISKAPTSQKVYGPSILYLGDLVDTEIELIGQALNGRGGVLHRFGFDDGNTADLLIQLAEKRALPELTVAYFPDNDFRSHEVGPLKASSVLENLDARLGEMIAAFGGLDSFLEETCVLITGDHSQSDVRGDETAGIRLDKILANFSLSDTGAAWKETDQLLICPALRVAQIYFREPGALYFKQVVKQILDDPRVDQAIWRANLQGDSNGYWVATRDRGQLHFWPAPEQQDGYDGQYGNRWAWRGELAAVDGSVRGNQVTSTTYPNAFERIRGGLDAKSSGHLWVTAKPGYELQTAETSIHLGGGSHGSLHALDSISPLLVAGAP
ncbi:MAG: alkaline phosphatase family protein, partial [Anaerolineae bacterium]|nr:alkaline phosphatase family protein [Anaerolineae bacterium]